jgi:hypothetical protein
MLAKLVRADYYNQEYLLNEYEYKGTSLDLTKIEFNFPKIDQYWRIRALIFTFSLDPMGDKETLIKRIENELFYNYLYKRQPDDELREVTDTELEVLMKFSKNKKLGPSMTQMEDEIQASWEKFAHADDLVQELEWPWDIVREIARQNRRFTYLDIHRSHF